MKRFSRNTAFYVILALVLLILALTFLTGGPKREQLTLSEFEGKVSSEQVKTAEIIDGDNKVRGDLTNGKKYEAKYPAEYVDELTASLKSNGVAYDTKPKKDNLWLSLLFNFLPFLLLIGVFLFVMNSMQGGGS
ncbi:MAG: cell division protease FtsH, partial [Actinomycetota bacterium]